MFVLRQGGEPQETHRHPCGSRTNEAMARNFEVVMTEDNANAAGGTANSDWRSHLIPPPLALPFLLHTKEIGRLVNDLPSPNDPDVVSIRDALGELHQRELAWAFAGVSSILLEAVPTLQPIFDGMEERKNVRSAGTDGFSMASLLTYLLENPTVIPLVVLSLRLLGENKFKVGKFEIKTGSVLRDLAELVRGRKN
jgi:hypothetical protein